MCAIDPVKVVVDDGVSESEGPHSAHLVVPGFCQDNVSVAVVGTPREKIVPLNRAVVTLPHADLAVVIQNRVVTVGVPAGLVGDHLGFAGIVIRSADCRRCPGPGAPSASKTQRGCTGVSRTPTGHHDSGNAPSGYSGGGCSTRSPPA